MDCVLYAITCYGFNVRHCDALERAKAKKKLCGNYDFEGRIGLGYDLCVEFIVIYTYVSSLIKKFIRRGHYHPILIYFIYFTCSRLRETLGMYRLTLGFSNSLTFKQTIQFCLAWCRVQYIIFCSKLACEYPGNFAQNPK